MPDAKEQLIVTIVIIAVTTVLIFLGVMFLVMVVYYNKKKLQTMKEKQIMKDLFEKQLLQAKLEMQEQTFNFISQEIHDNVGQVLSVAKVELNIVDQQPVIDKSILRDAKNNISKAITELREIAKNLSSENSHSFDLINGIKEEINRINRSGLIKASMKVNGTDCPIKSQYRIILFRVIQESMQNIIKHAQASEILICIEYSEKKWVVGIRDNGIGFNVDTELKRDSGLGLKNIIKRAILIGGNAMIKSAPGEGTNISISIPHD